MQNKMRKEEEKSSQQQISPIRQDAIIDNTIKAILDRAAYDSVKDSPVVSAAMKTIYEFSEAQEKAEVDVMVPQGIFMAIMQLTGFL